MGPISIRLPAGRKKCNVYTGTDHFGFGLVDFFFILVARTSSTNSTHQDELVGLVTGTDFDRLCLKSLPVPRVRLVGERREKRDKCKERRVQKNGEGFKARPSPSLFFACRFSRCSTTNRTPGTCY